MFGNSRPATERKGRCGCPGPARKLQFYGEGWVGQGCFFCVAGPCALRAFSCSDKSTLAHWVVPPALFYNLHKKQLPPLVYDHIEWSRATGYGMKSNTIDGEKPF